ncbi:MAG: glycosyltransferase [Proteobacteria bacterium]|nr:glycosyltransferase [Pseudomonadota bacterium]
MRALDWCRAGDFLRATVLLRYVAPVDQPTRAVYADGLLVRRWDWAKLLTTPDHEPPGFITDYAIDALPIGHLKARHAGKRLLVVRRFAYTKEQYGVGDNLRRAAIRFGLVVHELDSVRLPGPAGDAFIAELYRTIEDMRPSVIFWDELFLSGISAEPRHRDDVAQLLATVRRRFGVRVIKYYGDVWYIMTHMPHQLFEQLGDCYDLVNHMHPAIRHVGTDAERQAVFCCPTPAEITPPTEPYGTIPRACIIGSIHPGGIPRIVWWAECVRAGLPLDFIETFRHGPYQLSDQEYVNTLRRYQLSITLSLRDTGTRIFTGRAHDIPLAGGVLLEEHSEDTHYFLQAGVHYAAFETLPDLAALIPEMLADEARRQRIAAAAHAWVARYYTGDCYWAGTLSKLFP